MIDDFKPAERSAKSLRTAPNKLTETQTSEPETPAETFRTPEEVAAEQNLPVESDAGQATPEAEPPGKLKHDWRKILSLSWPPGRKEWLVAAAVLVLLGGGITTWALTHQSKPVVAVHKVAPKPKKVAPVAPKTVPSALTGLPVDPSLNAGPVTGVMIENSDFARPQSGLGQAGIVFEAIAEGGITRFLALFQDTAPTDVGPIRSARPYYEQWALGFDAGYAHVGGSPEALADIKTWGVRDLDQYYNAGSYHRISSRDSPHNVYTGIPTLNQLESSKGYTGSSFTSLPRKKDAPAKLPTAKTINLALSGPNYNVQYQYDATTNSYLRNMAGAPHMDANTNTQINPKVVIALVMPYGLESDGYHSNYTTIGSGTVYIFQDGTVTAGQWSKASGPSQFIFTDTANAVIKLNAGRTWLTAVANTGAVTYTP